MEVAMKKTRMAIVAALLLGAAAPVLASSAQPPIPLLTGPQDPSQMNATINGVINSINGILTPLVPATPGVTAVNFVSLTPSRTGYPATIGLATGSDSNGSLAIVPKASGNIILFTANTTAGYLQFGNASAFTAATGFAACPGVTPHKRPFGVDRAVRGFLVVKDWLGNQHGVPTC
jgi:hypothetical protein